MRAGGLLLLPVPAFVLVYLVVIHARVAASHVPLVLELPQPVTVSVRSVCNALALGIQVQARPELTVLIELEISVEPLLSTPNLLGPRAQGQPFTRPHRVEVLEPAGRR